MTYKDYRIIAVTPAGRRQYLEILIPQIKAYQAAGVVDEYVLWVNTNNAEDILYMEKCAQNDPDFIKLIRLPNGVTCDGNFTIHHFFKHAVDENAVYVRFDDDILCIDTVIAFKRFLDFRINNPNFFMVYANILNNAVCAHILQRMRLLDTKAGLSGYNCLDRIGWNDGNFVANLHDQVIRALEAGTGLTTFRYDNEWCLFGNERVSINCIAWMGGIFKHQCDGIVGYDEEQEIACNMPRQRGLINVIFGSYCVLHYAFFSQRAHLDSNGYFEKIKKLVS